MKDGRSAEDNNTSENDENGKQTKIENKARDRVRMENNGKERKTREKEKGEKVYQWLTRANAI